MGHAQRPRPGSLTLPEQRRAHILDGEPDSRRGGHRHGTGRLGKTEFPARWDDATVIGHVLDVARRPDEAPELRPNGRWQMQGVRDDVTVVVILQPDGKIVTSFPRAGGRGVVQNPEE